MTQILVLTLTLTTVTNVGSIPLNTETDVAMIPIAPRSIPPIQSIIVQAVEIVTRMMLATPLTIRERIAGVRKTEL